MRHKWRWIATAASLGLMALSPLASARAGTVITVDENGNGTNTVGQGFIGNDPGPGGLNNVLIYNLPFVGTQGDVHLTDSDFGNTVLDVIRFNGNSTLIFYSDNVDGSDSRGDTPSPPGTAYTNLVTIPELGTERDNGAFYTPLPGQPGYDAAMQPTYVFISDGLGPPSAAVPEPSTLVSACIAVLTGLGYGWRRAKVAA